MRRCFLALLIALLLPACVFSPGSLAGGPIQETSTASQPPASTSDIDQRAPAETPAPAVPGSTALGSPTRAALPNPPSNASPFPTPAGPPGVRTSYRLAVILHYDLHQVEVNETINFSSPSQLPLDRLTLAVDANTIPGAFNLVSITGSSVISSTLSSNRLELRLEPPLLPAQAASLDLKYKLDLPALSPGGVPPDILPAFGYTARQLDLVNWYPYLPPYREGEGWLLHEPFPFGEYQVYELADFDVDVTLEEASSDLVLAASSIGQTQAGVTRYSLSGARNFVLSASPYYQVYTQTSGAVTLFSYTFPSVTAGGKAALQETAKALVLYQRLFGPYPHAALSIVVGDFEDGMEADGLYFLGKSYYDAFRGTPDGYLALIAVHETAHQWWYGRVGSDQFLEPWLDEALSTYSERLYYENTYPSLAGWWWSFRVYPYAASLPVNSHLADFKSFLAYRNTVYLNGAKFLESLRGVLGPEAFFAFLKEYSLEEDGRISTQADFFRILSHYAPAGSNGVIHKYFEDLPVAR